jgi:hypothetical protein
MTKFVLCDFFIYLFIVCLGRYLLPAYSTGSSRLEKEEDMENKVPAYYFFTFFTDCICF